MEHQTNGTNNEELTLAQRILVRAAELISIKKNWIKGLLRDQSGYCMLGAIHRATEDITGERLGEDPQWFLRPGPKEVIDLVSARIPNCKNIKQYTLDTAYNPSEVKAIHRYNDTHTTTHEDVKAVFCKVVKEELGYESTAGSDDTRAE